MVIIQDNMPTVVKKETTARETTIIERCQGREVNGKIWQWYRRTVMIAGLIMSQDEFNFEVVGGANEQQAGA